MKRSIASLAAILALLMTVASSQAEAITGLINGSFSSDARALVADQSRQKAYVADYANQRLMILDGAILEVSALALPGRPRWLAISKDGSRLGIALDSSNFALVDLTTLSVINNVQFAKSISTFDFDTTGSIYFSTSDTFGTLWYGNPTTGSAKEVTFTGKAFQPTFFADALVRTDGSGNNLYIQDGPGGVKRAIVTAGTASSLIESSGSAVGVNDFRLDPTGANIYAASTIPNGLVKIPTATMATGNVLTTEDTPVSVDVNPDGSIVYALSSYVIAKPNLSLFSTSTLGLLTSFDTPRRSGIFFSKPQAKSLGTLNDGKLRVYLEGYDGTVDAAQKGWQIAIQGEIPDAPVPQIVSTSLSVNKLTNKGGPVTISVQMSQPTYVEAVRVSYQCKFKVKTTKPLKGMLLLATSNNTGTYSIVYKVPKKAAGSTCTFTAQVQQKTNEPITGPIGKVAVAAPKKK